MMVLVNYGLAGVVVYLFYTLLSGEIRGLRDEIRELRRTIEILVNVVRRNGQENS